MAPLFGECCERTFLEVKKIVKNIRSRNKNIVLLGRDIEMLPGELKEGYTRQPSFIPRPRTAPVRKGWRRGVTLNMARLSASRIARQRQPRDIHKELVHALHYSRYGDG